jgi:branched-chain amino acid transport system permease protein
VYGGLLVFMMIFRPNGLLGGVDFRRMVKKIFNKNAKPTTKTTGTNL